MAGFAIGIFYILYMTAELNIEMEFTAVANLFYHHKTDCPIWARNWNSFSHFWNFLRQELNGKTIEKYPFSTFTSIGSWWPSSSSYQLQWRKFLSKFSNINFKILFIWIQRPALSLRISQPYFENNISGQDGFTLNGGYYEKTIDGAELQLVFDDVGDRKLSKIIYYYNIN